MIKADPVAVADSDQEEVEQDLNGGEVGEETAGNQSMIDPAEGALDFSDPIGIEKSFVQHGHHLRDRMVPFSLRQGDLSIWACISRQGNLLKRNVISRGWIGIEACISRSG